MDHRGTTDELLLCQTNASCSYWTVPGRRVIELIRQLNFLGSLALGWATPSLIIPQLIASFFAHLFSQAVSDFLNGTSNSSILATRQGNWLVNYIYIYSLIHWLLNITYNWLISERMNQPFNQPTDQAMNQRINLILSCPSICPSIKRGVIRESVN